MCQIKSLIDKVKEAMVKCNADLENCVKEKDEALKQVGNMLHDDVPVSNDEVRLEICGLIQFIPLCSYMELSQNTIL